MAAASPWTHDQVTSAFRRVPELKSLLLTDVVDTGETLGEGAYGVVRKLRVAGATHCAGKMIHEVLIDRKNKGAKDVVINFLKECKMMADLRHPHIVQFMGMCLLPGSKMPTLVTELLTDCLHNFLETHPNLPMDMKVSFLTDVASALVFLHSRTPQIIHRDLTAKNVLVDERSMKAKVTDLGNSRFTARSTVAMTRQPGNLLYMAPEALEPNAKYCEKLDIFSFGHLSLYTLTQVYPSELLAPTIHTPDGDKLISRSEVERRRHYMDILKDALGKDHLLMNMVTLCLSNDPSKRPTAMKILKKLQDLNSDYDDVQPLQQKYVMMEKLNQKDKEIKDLREKLKAKESELELIVDVDLVRSGPLEKYSPKNIMRKWKLHTFHVTETHLKWCNLGEKQPRAEILLSDVTQVFIPHRSGRWGDKHCFEVQFNGGKDSWVLSAFSQQERKSWMEAIRKQKPRMKKNPAYEVVPPTSFAENAPSVDVHHYESISTLLETPPPLPPAVEKPALPDRRPDLKRSPAKAAPGPSQTKEQKLLPDDRVSQLTPQTPSFHSTCATLNRRMANLNQAQITYLITMLQQTNESVGSDETKEKGKHKPDNKLPRNSAYMHPSYESDDKLSKEEKEATFPRSGTKSPYYVNYTEVCERGRPSSVKTGGQAGPRPRSVSPMPRDSVYVTFNDMMGESVRSQSFMDLRDEDTSGGRHGRRPNEPSPYLEPCHKKQRETLRSMLKQSQKNSESLLVVDDDNSEDYTLRPLWAKANPNRPGPLTRAAMRQKGIETPPRTLKKVMELGKGRFGTVYKAELIRKGAKITVAVKSLPDNIMDDLREEVTIMVDVVHPNIARLYGLLTDGEMAPSLVMEYFTNRDLKSFLSGNVRTNPQLMKYMIDVAMGMHFLSEKDIIHRDLAARNVLVDKNELCKVADFGIIREVPQSFPESSLRRPSPVRWMAPESISKRIFSPASDIWSFGVLQWEMFNPHKLYPYPNLRDEEVLREVTGGYPISTPRKAPQVVVRIMKACWNRAPSSRPSFLLVANLLTSHVIRDE